MAAEDRLKNGQLVSVKFGPRFLQDDPGTTSWKDGMIISSKESDFSSNKFYSYKVKSKDEIFDGVSRDRIILKKSWFEIWVRKLKNIYYIVLRFSKKEWANLIIIALAVIGLVIAYKALIK